MDFGHASIKRVWDLSQPIFHNCPGGPGNPLVRVDLIRVAPRDGYNLEQLTTTTHSGPHVDAPLHFIDTGRSITDYLPEDFIGPCRVVDVRTKRPDEEITVEDLARYSESILPGSIVLFSTGWGKKRAFTNEWVHHSPWLGAKAAQFLVDKGVKGVGIDHFSIGTTRQELDTPTHLTLLKNGVWIAEDLLIPDEVIGLRSLFYIGVPL